MRPAIVLHLKEKDLSRDLAGWHLALYPHIRRLAEATGTPFHIRARDADIRVGTRQVTDGRFDDGNLHILDDRSLRMPNVLNAGVAYFWQFWHLDPRGVKAFSAIAARAYDPSRISPRRAAAFFEKMRARYPGRRRSKYGQVAERMSFPPGAVSVFFQGGYPVASGAAETDDLGMLRQVLEGAGDRSVIVKPHPLASDEATIRAARRIAAADARVTVTEANVHDILAASAATVSINSTVALEGFLHRVPAVLFGQADFHHFAGTVGPGRPFARVLAEELERQDGFEPYLAWYFLANCLPLNSGKLADRIAAAFAGAGFVLTPEGLERRDTAP